MKAIELVEGRAVESAIDPKLAAAGVVCVAAHRRQMKALEQRSILISRAIPKNSMLVAARDAVTSVLGPVRVAAVRKEGTSDQVRLRFCMELAWAVRKPDALRWIEGA